MIHLFVAAGAAASRRCDESAPVVARRPRRSNPQRAEHRRCEEAATKQPPTCRTPSLRGGRDEATPNVQNPVVARRPRRSNPQRAEHRRCEEATTKQPPTCRTPSFRGVRDEATPNVQNTVVPRSPRIHVIPRSPRRGISSHASIPAPQTTGQHPRHEIPHTEFGMTQAPRHAELDSAPTRSGSRIQSGMT